MSRPGGDCRPGFTLIELLVSISAIGLLIGLLLPALVGSRGAAQRALCMSNQRQMVIAATMYAEAHRGHLMPSLYTNYATAPARRVGWDLVEVYTPGGVTREPAAMWASTSPGDVMRCPSMLGPSNWAGDDAGDGVMTGYNYNTSYLGGPTIGPDPSHPSGSGPRWNVHGEPIAASARFLEIRDPSACVVFGDGAFAGGANKFMRAPWSGDRDSDISHAGHAAGAQGFVHLGSTIAAFADGHVEGVARAYRETYPAGETFLADGAGFLSEGNGLYDLEFGR